MATVNYAEQYSRALSQEFPYVLNFGKLYTTPNNKTYKVVDSKTIKIPVVTTSGRTDGNRDNITSFKRNVDNDWETKDLTNHREWDTLLHPQDVNQSNMVLTIQNATKVMNETQKFPEMDAYCVSKIHTDAVAEGVVDDTTTLTVDNILSIFDKYMEDMDEARVPQTGRILYVTPAINTLIKNAKDIVKTINVSGSATALNRTISRIDEVEIVKVPSELMKTVYDFSNGWKPGTTAKQINMLLIHPIAVFTPVSYSFASMEEPSAHSKGKYLYYEESFEDVFILNNKKKAIKFNVSE
ncbi:MAG: capsid protein [Bacilli bacterium]|nr:capsid protein [Bacilli bacterium]